MSVAPPPPGRNAEHNASTADGTPGTAPAATLTQVIGAVLWGLLGVRKRNAMRRDVAAIKPHQIILVGVAIVALLVATLLIAVRVIVSGAG